MARDNGGKPQAGIGAVIKRYREDQRVTQRELAATACMSVGALRDLEQGRTRSPRWGTLEVLSAALGLGQAQRIELTRAFQADDPRVAMRPERHAGRRPGVLPGGESGILPGMRIEILGPLAAWRDGQRLALGSPRQCAVFGLLALHPDVGVHREAIIDMLWPERPPASAAAKVQGYVSRLRKSLRDAGARAHTGDAQLVATVGGRSYCLNARSGHLDLVIFWQLVREAREATARSDPARACDRYEQALELWRGDILADVDLLRHQPAAVEVTRRRAEVVLGYAEAAAGAGAPSRALSHLRELCTREPLNEQSHARFMIALADAGHQAAALQVFADLRRRLDTELGITPSRTLTSAYTRFLRQQFS